jgi:hypothetical protein
MVYVGIIVSAVIAGLPGLVGCDDSNVDVGPTNIGGQEIQWPIEWPSRFLAGDAENATVRFTVYVPEGAGGIGHWAKLYYRETPDQESSETGYEAYGSAEWTQQVSYTLTFSETGPGIYTVQIGITDPGYDFWEVEYAQECYQYQFFVGDAYYYHNVDIEYIHQRDCKIYSGAYDFYGTTALPFVDTRVCFNLADFPQEHEKERVEYNFDSFLKYRKLHGAYWDPDTANPIYRYFLAGVEGFTDADQQPIANVGGAIGRAGIAMVACGQINDVFINEGVPYCKLWAATHELGHIVGAGLNDVCGNEADHNTSQPCLMNHVRPAVEFPYIEYWCDGSGSENFSFFLEFCDSCRAKLSNSIFLMQDLAQMKACGRGPTTRTLTEEGDR